MRYLVLFVMSLWLSPMIGNSQVFMGGDVKIERDPVVPTFMFNVEIDIYYATEDTTYNGHSIPINVSAGFIGRVDWVRKSVLSKNLVQFRYKFSSAIGVENNTVVQVDTIFTFEDVNNLSINPANFILSNAFRSTPIVVVQDQDIANFENNHDTYYFDQEGVLHYPIDVSESDGNQVDLGFENVLTYENDFYELPAATDSIYVDNIAKEFIWDRPTAPGKYLFAFRLLEYSPGVLVFGAKERFQVIEIKESDLVVNTKKVSDESFKINLFPNPTTSTLHLQLKHAQSTQGKLQIENLSGQTLHAEALNLSPDLQSCQVNVADWPSGVYVVRLLAGSDQVVRKFVKE
ncbi:MAG: T9SS type A sorting domain-containing protein [bacterium]|nr:T9SS type A sorting domain-containing protein [bacterium]